MTYRIEMMPGRASDSDDSPWEPVRIEPTVDADNLMAMCRVVADLEFDADGRDQFRIVEVTTDYVDHWVPAECEWVKIRSERVLGRVA